MNPASGQVLQLLSSINQVLVSSPDPLSVLEPILNSLAEGLGSPRALLTKVNRRTDELEIAATVGINADSRRRLQRKLHDTVVAQVMQTVVPAIFEQVPSPHPVFEDDPAIKNDCAFLCLPIKLGPEVVGTIGLDRPLATSPDLGYDQQVVSIVASMIAQSVRLRQRAVEEQTSLLAENEELRDLLEQRFRPGNMAGGSKLMREVFGMVARVAESDATVLIRGESGVGKELVSRAIHFGSLRAAGPFIKVNCAALPPNLIESELFGHEKGAFTGAVERRKGRFERADDGSLFLDEIGDLPQTTQALLLRFLQEREFERIGGTETLRADVRVIASTNRDLEKLVEQGTFREDLYYRLNVYPIHVPALRDRMTDVPALADHFLEKYAKTNRKQIDRISSPAIDLLMTYNWPGNVRELENCIERAVLLTADRVVRSHNLPPTVQTADATGTRSHGSLDSAIQHLEQEMITDALIATHGNRAKAARTLGMTERQMGIRVQKLGIDWRSYRRGRH